MDLTQYYESAFWVLQAAVGIIFIIHGLAKIKSPKQIASAYGMPTIAGMLHGLVEAVGGLMLIVGWYTQWVGVLFAAIMVGAIFFKISRWKMPFMAQNATGWEFDLILLAAALLIASK
jgi:putative oxidoreductase